MFKRRSGGDAWKRCVAGILALVAVVTMARLVELYIDGTWTDVTTGGHVLADDPITITDGADSQSVLSSPGSCTLSLYDPDKAGRWSNRVPGSTYYRKLGRNTPIRVSVDGDVRCVQEIPEWNPRWELGPDGGAKVHVPIQAAGILRRLTEGGRALPTPIERSIRATSPEAYWTLGDGSGSSSAASGVNGRPMTVLSGTVEFGAEDDLSTSSTTPNLSAGSLVGTISGISATAWHVEFMLRVDAPDSGIAVRLYAGSSATHAIWRVGLPIADPDGISIFVGGLDDSVDFVLAGGSWTHAEFLGQWWHYALTAEQIGTDVRSRLYVNGVLIDSLDVAGTLEAPDRILIGHNVGAIDSAAHVVAGSGSTISTAYDAIGDYAGETVGRRIERLLGEEGVAFVGVGDLDDTAAMGPQLADTLVANLEACAVADQGRLYETRTALGLTYRTRVSLYNQYGVLLDYGLVAPPLEPNEDLTFAHNDVTVSRPGGSSARSTLDPEDVVDPYHTLSTGNPPDGIGTYDPGPVTAHVQTDDQLQQLADWLRHHGTWDELRYPSLTVEFAAPDIVANPTLAAQLAALETGAQLRLDSLPAWLPPDQYAALVQGRVEVIGTHTRSITWNLAPGWPWEVWEMESGGSTLAAAVASNGTSLKLTTSAGPPWKTGSPLGTPFYIQAAGNAMKVTTLTTDTPAFIAAGTVDHDSNASVTPGLPAGMTPDVGQVILGWSAIRNSGTGVPDLPTGYTNLALFGNTRFFGKYYVTGDSTPTCSFTGGAANATTSARLFGFSGLSLNLDDGDYRSTTPSPQTLLNSSAQNIAWPALSVRRDGSVVFLLLWKQDDGTSIATPASMDAEMSDDPSTLGDDQYIAAYYDIQTTATDIAAGSAVVTGGAAAISRAVVLALRPLQTATVERGVNGVSTAISAGEAVYGWRLGVLGL